MLIFIDESGNFSGIGVPGSIGALGALIIPESRWSKLQREYAALRPHLPKNAKGEVKGSMLDETQAAQVIALLRRHEALFEGVIVDLGLHTEEMVRRHQMQQAVGMTSQLTDAHHPSVVKGLWASRQQFEQLPPQLYIQSRLMFNLIREVLVIAPNYYAQRRPRELAAFHWVIDAKDVQPKPTPSEEWWSKFIMPWMQTANISNPIGWCYDFNFSFTKRFYIEPTPFQRSLFPPGAFTARNQALSLNLILGESFRFSAGAEPGLELVDMTTTILRRALVGTIGRLGWQSLSGLIVNRKGENLQILALRGAENPAKRLPYTGVVKALRNSPRSMIATARKTNVR